MSNKQKFLIREVIRLKKRIAELEKVLEYYKDAQVSASWDEDNRRQELMSRPEYHEMGQ